MYGPLLTSLIQGSLHALWHLPGYFVPGAISTSGFDPGVFIGNSIAIVAGTFMWTWLFNSAGGSVLFAMLVHATDNAAAQYLSQVAPADAGWWGYASLWLVVLLIITCTRGRLGYRGEQRSTELR